MKSMEKKVCLNLKWHQILSPLHREINRAAIMVQWVITSKIVIATTKVIEVAITRAHSAKISGIKTEAIFKIILVATIAVRFEADEAVKTEVLIQGNMKRATTTTAVYSSLLLSVTCVTRNM